MPLAPGGRFGQYKVQSLIGKGGMGEVYRATDTQLKRDVALKILPGQFASDPDRTARFQREAEVLASLNHPNIATLYGIEESGGALALAMEVVEGETLAAYLARGPLTLRQALEMAIQIAAALGKAHGAGIVHRDLKPANVMVMADGLVKVLDFGLAKRVEVSGGGNVTQTLTQISREGLIAGTAGYMSPEQAEGKRVDERSDVFSFGALLYEMVTGRRAFTGDTPPSTLAAVIKDQPKPPRELAPHLPLDLEKLILRCLQKDPNRRSQSMTDLPVALQEIQEEIRVASGRKTSHRWRLAVIAAASLAIVASAVSWLGARRTGPPPKVIPLTADPGQQAYPTFSPDGAQVAFRGVEPDGSDSIYVKMLGDSHSLRLTTDRGPVDWPAWSPDGKRIAFERAGSEPRSRTIHLISPLGGSEQELTDFLVSGQMSWSPEGKWLAVGQYGPGRPTNMTAGIFLVPLAGGEPRRITDPKLPGGDSSPAFSRDGRSIAYSSCSHSFMCDVYLLGLDANYVPRGAPRRITRQQLSIEGLAWAGDSLIYAGSLSWGLLNYLWRVEPTGRNDPERLDLAGAQAFAPTVSRSGARLAYSRKNQNLNIWRYQEGGTAIPFITSALDDASPKYSPDGTKIVFSSARSGENYDIWTADADGSHVVQLTNRVGRGEGSPHWSQDGRWIAFDSLREDGTSQIFVVDATGGRPRQLTSDPWLNAIPVFSRDRQWIYFNSDRSGQREIWRVPFSGGKAVQMTDKRGWIAEESTDGETLYYSKEGTGGIFAKPLANGVERKLVDGTGASTFSVFEDGLYYTDGGESLRFYPFSTGESRLIATMGGYARMGMTVSLDRKTILFAKRAGAGSNLMLIERFR